MGWVYGLGAQGFKGGHGSHAHGQAGLAGLARGIAAWDPSRGTRLGSCCYYYIMDEVGAP